MPDELPPGLPVMIRIARTLRVFKVLRYFKGVGVIIRSVTSSVGNVAQIGALWLTVFLVYAIMARFLFHNVPQGQMAPYFHFRSFGRSMLSLFYCSTGEGWNVTTEIDSTERSVMSPRRRPPSLWPPLP